MTKQISDEISCQMKEILSETPEDAIKRIQSWREHPEKKLEAFRPVRSKINAKQLRASDPGR